MSDDDKKSSESTSTTTNDSTNNINIDNNDETVMSGGRLPTADERDKINDIIQMLRQQNVNVTSINLNDNSKNDTSSSSSTSNQMTAVAGNVIGDNNMYLLESEEKGDAGLKKHAFWDTQVSDALY